MKKVLLLAILIMVTACGFKPMFSGQDTDIYVEPISGINGIELRNALWAKFGGQHGADATYKLTINLGAPNTQYKALEQTGDATWQEVSLTATYVLTYKGEQIATGTERAAESYTFVRYLVASNASYNNAVKNTINVLAEKIGARTIAETHKYAHTDKDTDAK
ncbi:MAG: hypothetical protein R8N50_02775 [Alphaproteobacteria bacterium]|nr:hypothetical protein [Alphaproteobacteria bacterium]